MLLDFVIRMLQEQHPPATITLSNEPISFTPRNPRFVFHGEVSDKVVGSRRWLRMIRCFQCSHHPPATNSVATFLACQPKRLRALGGLVTSVNASEQKRREISGTTHEPVSRVAPTPRFVFRGSPLSSELGTQKPGTDSGPGFQVKGVPSLLFIGL